MSEAKSDPKQSSLTDLLRLCCKALDDKKAEDLRVLHLGSKSSIADYFVIATGTSNPPLRALRVELEKTLDSNGGNILGAQMDTESGWVVVDAYDVIFHFFTREMRQHYSLEQLWKDSKEVSVEDLLKAS